MRIWTQAYSPFIMGGDCYAPIMCEWPVDGPIDLGKGIQGFLAVSPGGQTFVVEAETGGIVGTSIKDVRRDIEVADPAVMEAQIVAASQGVLRARSVTSVEFWRRLA